MAPMDDYSKSWEDVASSIKPEVDYTKKPEAKKDIRRYGSKFLVDYEANAAYNTAKPIDKSSPFIRNFTTQMRYYSPELNEFFDDFAIDILKPESITWEEVEDKIRYETKYLCRGTVETEDFVYMVRKVAITAKKLEEGLLEFTMSNLYLSRIDLELRLAPAEEKPSGVFGKLKAKFKK